MITDVQSEILDLLLMGSETLTALSEMLDTDSRDRLVSDYGDVHEGLAREVRQLVDAGLLRSSDVDPRFWGLTEAGRAAGLDSQASGEE